MKEGKNMHVGCVKEIKKYEFRVGLTPDNVREYVGHGHAVFIQSNAGEGASFSDDDYKAAGAIILEDAKSVWAQSEMIIKVKEPLPEEYPLMRSDQILYTYLHLAANHQLTEALLASGAKGVAYETITDDNAGLPLLKPMSEVAGRLSVQNGAKCLEKPMGGMGLLLGGVPGVAKAKVIIIGGGVVGTNACKMAIGLGAEVTILDKSLPRLTYLDDIFGSQIQTMYSTTANIERLLYEADMVICGVLIPGAAAPRLIKKTHLKKMKTGSVIVDVAVDQGGCCETTKATYHDDPTFVVDGVVHYCVANMPGAVSNTSTVALTNATLQYGLMLADNGVEDAVQKDKNLFAGVNTYKGKLTCKAAADSLSIEYTSLSVLL